jgi:hypothetical protein
MVWEGWMRARPANLPTKQKCMNDRLVSSREDDADGAPLAYLFPARLAPSNIRIIAGAIVVVQESIEKSP